MRAGFINSTGAPDILQVGDLATPEPGPGEVRVRIQFAALNHLDLWIRKGIPGQRLKFPHILGADGAGIVDKVGKGAKSSVGREVVIYPGLSCGACPECRTGLESLCPQYKILGEQVGGTNAEFLVLPEANIFEKPQALSFEDAAALPLVFITAWEMVAVKARVTKGQRVLIHGAGSGVSTAAIQIAKHLGAEVIATSSHEEKLSLAKELGADVLVNTATSDFTTVSKKVDAIIDHVGGVFWERNIRCLKSGGTLVSCGATSGWDAKTDLRHLFFRQLKLLGSTMGSRRDFPEILRLASEKKFHAVIDKVFPLAELSEAHRHLEAGRQFGKVLISFN